MGSEVQDREFARHLRARGSLAELAARFHPPGAPVGCVRPRSPEHRATDWRPVPTDEQPTSGQWTCGKCHPYPEGEDGPLIKVECRAR